MYCPTATPCLITSIWKIATCGTRCRWCTWWNFKSCLPGFPQTATSSTWYVHHNSDRSSARFFRALTFRRRPIGPFCIGLSIKEREGFKCLVATQIHKKVQETWKPRITRTVNEIRVFTNLKSSNPVSSLCKRCPNKQRFDFSEW